VAGIEDVHPPLKIAGSGGIRKFLVPIQRIAAVILAHDKVNRGLGRGTINRDCGGEPEDNNQRAAHVRNAITENAAGALARSAWESAI